ncbi:DUF309 domain-containing protein [uncultured Roseobacter sp.]|uniref:DUF309 domain-containing protein n=1 Tax=uncultured Roseobacter sp. TaxID=114847 RepID=UPI00262E685F|nr:DUF309 domain-containing protein [uncultured Roseobacter sp.]
MSCSPDLPEGVPRPPHVYVPGKTDRHPEDWFDGIKASALTAKTPQALHQTAAFQTGLAYLEAGYFWECHEVLEAVWLQTVVPSAERDMVQALIQLANAQLKLLMERPRATLRLCETVGAHLERCPQSAVTLGLWPAAIRAQMEDVQKRADDEL